MKPKIKWKQSRLSHLAEFFVAREARHMDHGHFNEKSAQRDWMNVYAAYLAKKILERGPYANR